MNWETKFWECTSLLHAAQSELSTLREELAQAAHVRTFWAESAVELDKRLTAAEQRNAALIEAMERIHFRCESFSDEALGMKKHSVRVMLDIAAKVLGKPTESGASDKCFSDGGTCGLGGQCAECPHKESVASE